MARITIVRLRVFWRKPYPTRSLILGRLWCLEFAQVHRALAQVAATALSCDGREWVQVAGRRFSTTESVLPA